MTIGDLGQSESLDKGSGSNGAAGSPICSAWLRAAAIATAVAACVWLVASVLFIAVTAAPVLGWEHRVEFPLPASLRSLLVVQDLVASPFLVNLEYALVAVVALLVLRWRDARRRRWLRVWTGVLVLLAVLDVASYSALAANGSTIDLAATEWLIRSSDSSVDHMGYEITPLVCLSYLAQYLPLVALACLVFCVPLHGGMPSLAETSSTCSAASAGHGGRPRV